MKNSKRFSMVALMLSGFMASNSAQAISTLSGDLNIDDVMEIYISQDETAAGTVIETNAPQYDKHWWGASNFSNVILEKDVSYFLHVKGTNDFGFIAGFIGSFMLTGDDHRFSDSLTTTSMTGDGSWLVSSTGWGIDENTTTIRTQVDPWSGVNLGNVDSDAVWVWDSQDNEANDEAYFTLAISAVDFAPVPVPGAVWLFGTGLLGFIGMRKKAIKA